MPHPIPRSAPPPAGARPPVLGLERDARGRLFSPQMRERFAHLGVSATRAEVIAAVSVADKKVSFLLDRTFEQVGLSLAQVRVLAIIRHHGDTGAQMSAIALACNVVPRTTTGVVDGLEAAGLVERVPDPTIVGTAMPTIARDLGGVNRYTWVITVYLLTSTAVVPVVGKLSEQLGRKRVFLTAIVAFLAGSALCGLAPSMDWLIAFRGL